MRIWIAVAFLLSAAPATATSFQIDGSVVTHALGLEVNGSLYDIAFLTGSFNLLSFRGYSVLVGGSSRAVAMRDALVAELPNLNVGSSSSEGQRYFYVAYGVRPIGVSSASAERSGGWHSDGLDAPMTTAHFVYVIATPSEIPEPEIPEPTTVLLLATGLAGLAWRVRGH